MLKIYYGKMENAIYNTSQYFDNSYLDSWIIKDFSQKIIKSIDEAIVVSPQAVDSKFLGVIPVTKLSGGTKTLLLMYNEPNKVFNASTCGDNCSKLILEIADEIEDDLIINLHHLMDFKKKKFEIEIMNSHKIVHNMEELILESLDFLNEGEEE